MFGTDFAQDQHIQSLLEDKGMLYLLEHTLEGIMKEIINPLITVRLNHLRMHQLAFLHNNINFNPNYLSHFYLL